MLRKTRVLLLSCSAILLCICIISGITFALFTDSVESKHHLRAGRLDAVLRRTKLEYRIPNEEGYLCTYLDLDTLEFTQDTQNEENIFGLNGDILIAPGSYFESTMCVLNHGTVAFTYDITIEFSTDSSPDLPAQLLVSVIQDNGTKSVDKVPLNTLRGSVLVGTISPNASPQSFKVRLEFIDSPNNNAAQQQTACFDMYVSATQATKQ